MDHSHHHTEHHKEHLDKEGDVTPNITIPHLKTIPCMINMQDTAQQIFLKRFWICLVITIPGLLLSEMIQHWVGFDITFQGDKYVLLFLGTVIYFYGGMPFLKGMVSE